MAWYGKEQHGKTEVRKELALIAMAHRGVFVHQSSQASASHLMAGVLQGTAEAAARAVQHLHAVPGGARAGRRLAQHAARLALESRAFPYLTFDPDAGRTWADCLSLDGNPSVDDDWPTYTLEYVDDDGRGADDGAAADDRRLGGDGRALPQALQADRRDATIDRRGR